MNDLELDQELRDTLKQLNENFLSKCNECSLLYRKIEALEEKIKELKSDKEFLSKTVDEHTPLISQNQALKSDNHSLQLRLNVAENQIEQHIRLIEYWSKRCEALQTEKNGSRTTLEQYAHEVAVSMNINDDAAWDILGALSRNYKPNKEQTQDTNE